MWVDRESLSNENFTTRDPSNKNYNSPTHPSDQFDNAFEYIKDGEFEVMLKMHLSVEILGT